MTRNSIEAEDEDLGSSPSRVDDPRVRHEITRAFVWVAVVGAVVFAIYIARPLLVIFGAMVFAAMIDGGARLLGRVLPIARVWLVAIVLLLTVLFFAWLGFFAGSQISQEAAQFPSIIQQQLFDLIAWGRAQGFDISQAQVEDLAGQAGSGLSAITSALGGLFGALATVLLIGVIGIYLAFDPLLYERGVAWMLPPGRRGDFYITASRMAYTLRRLLAGRLVGMVFEGVFTYILLAFGGQIVGVGPVPMAALLAILTGLLAFIPNLGAIVAGALMVLVGFSGGVDMGLYTIGVYLLVQTFDGYVVVPMIAKKTVDLAPALVLAAQLIMGIVFGILGLFLADPLLAMIKVALERRAEKNGAGDEAQGEFHDPEPEAAASGA